MTPCYNIPESLAHITALASQSTPGGEWLSGPLIS